MKHWLKSLGHVFIGLFIVFLSLRCTTINIGKLYPEYKGVDSKLQPYVNEYKKLAKARGITFKNNVTIGFKDMGNSNTLGITNYGNGWREIDINKQFFDSTSEISKEFLLMHELSHAYCTRKHDWGSGQLYPALKKYDQQNPTVGIYKDGCPLSIMAPILTSDECMVNHYYEYLDEMFNRCESW